MAIATETRGGGGAPAACCIAEPVPVAEGRKSPARGPGAARVAVQKRAEQTRAGFPGVPPVGAGAAAAAGVEGAAARAGKPSEEGASEVVRAGGVADEAPREELPDSQARVLEGQAGVRGTGRGDGVCVGHEFLSRSCSLTHLGSRR